MHDALPVRACLRQRGINVPIACPLYNKEAKTTDHVLLKCELPVRVWKSSNLGLNIASDPTIGIITWLKNIMLYMMKEDGRDDLRLAEVIAIMWSIWIHRNECVFRGSRCDPGLILIMANGGLKGGISQLGLGWET
ncbi:uncharacterized protein [Spinacia oleracea]|uniref:Reverse transcriptase zinc-binding domain-containing protein n=1 Tax=Spinacia oleracea TaxID=3562 RepID=A0A9R0IYA0_SPIOL|nr:uncharacterized protein LOC110796999 [Spinacia oleracea]